MIAPIKKQSAIDALEKALALDPNFLRQTRRANGWRLSETDQLSEVLKTMKLYSTINENFYSTPDRLGS
jgi:hypothetical protein